MLATAAFASFAASFVTTPLVAHSASDVEPVRERAASPRRTMGAVAVVTPRRDPFADTALAAPAATPQAPVNAAATIPAALGPLPPNAGAPPLPFALSAPGSRVTAIVTGRQPFAIAEDDGAARIVTIGDRIGGETIVAIGPDGVRLERGRVLTVAPPTGAPSPRPEGMTR